MNRSSRARPDTAKRVRANSWIAPALVAIGFGILAYFAFRWESAADTALQSQPALSLLMIVVGACVWAWLIRIDVKHWRKRRRAKRRSAGLCPSCAYDFTGNVSGVCPECGAEVRAAA